MSLTPDFLSRMHTQRARVVVVRDYLRDLAQAFGKIGNEDLARRLLRYHDVLFTIDNDLEKAVDAQMSVDLEATKSASAETVKFMRAMIEQEKGQPNDHE